MKICLSCEGVTADTAPRCAHCGQVLLETTAVHFPERRGDGDSRDPLVGRVVDGKYRVIGVLGRGGMGTVYRAIHEVSLMHVALKVLHPRFSARAEFRSWFLAEARKAGRVVHENSARVTDVGVARDGMVYITVEFVDGVTLGEWLGHRQVVPARVLRILEQIARALAAAHAAGVVHRDLSPRNVMVTIRDGREIVKILDFGIALGRPRSAEADDDEDGAPSGFANPPYSAPEHLEGEAVDGRADLYSLGVIAFEALTGELPVRGTTGRELAAATREGRIRSMRARAGLPKSVVDLVNGLIERDPQDRPPSAEVVAERLGRLTVPRSRSIGVAAVSALVVSTAAFVLAHAPGAVTEAYLRSRGGPGTLVVGPPSETTQELRSLGVLDSRFDHAGFDPSDLELEIVRGDSSETLGLGAYVRRVGTALKFSPEANVLLHRLAAASRGAPVELRFLAPGRAPVGQARVQIDDDAPRVELSIPGIGEPSTALCGADRIVARVHDAGTIKEFRLEIALLRGPGARLRQVPLVADGTEIDRLAVDLLGGVLSGTRGWGAAELKAVAIDLAGNVGRSAVVEVSELDLRVPGLREVESANGQRTVIQDAGGAELRLWLSEAEPGLVALVQRPGEQEVLELTPRMSVGERLDLRLPPPSDASGIEPSGEWRFRVRDSAGNVSPALLEDLEFRSALPQLELRPWHAGDDAPRIVRLGERLVAATAVGLLDVQCNPVYRPARAHLARASGESLVGVAELTDVGAGVAALRIGTLAPGDYWISLELVEPDSEPFTVPDRVALRVLPDRVTLRLPDVAGARYLAELEDLSVLTVEGGRLRQGSAWGLDPPDARLVRGRLWRTVLGRTEPIETIAPSVADAQLFGDVPLARGWNELILELRDLLGRPVEIRTGERVLPPSPLPGGRSGAALPAFYHHDRPIESVLPEAFLEYAQPLRLELRSLLPPDDATRIRLRVAGSELAPRSVVSEADATRLSFALPFERVVEFEPKLADAAESDFAAGIEVELPFRVWTPAGEFGISTTVRTLRTTLRAVDLERFGEQLPPPIAGMHLVPIPAPPGGLWPDPVPAGHAARGAVRPAVSSDVRNVSVCFVLDRELTRAQYFAIVAAGLDRVAHGVADRSSIVHAADPLGVRRLTQAGLEPLAWPGRGVDWADALSAAPDRPISGVSAFQAHAVAGLLGLVAFGDATVFRLPLGVELEIAAAGSQRVEFALDRRSLAAPFVAADWPPSSAELARLGDVAVTELGDSVTGLQSGLREWVLDLAYVPGEAETRVLLGEWLTDLARHEQRARAWARHGPVPGIPGDLAVGLDTYGVLRGGAVDRLEPRDANSRLPGVVRVLQIRRDGEGLVPGRLDPHLAAAGFRIAGGREFVTEVRAKW